MASPQLQLLIDGFRSRPAADNITVEEQRAGFELMAQASPPPEGVRCAPVDAGGVPGEWIDAAQHDPGVTILHLHGGGYVIGSLNTHRGFSGRLAQATNARVLLIDYRLGPEHPHPAAVDDALTAYRWLLAQDVDPARLAVVGDSAGGGLTIALLLALREAGEPLPACAATASAWLDLSCNGTSMETKAAEDPVLSREVLSRWAIAYVPDGAFGRPLVSPLYADLSGLPPLLVQAGSAEVLLDDSTRFAERAQAADVDVTLEVWEEMVHDWHLFSFLLPEGQQGIERMAGWVRERIENGVTSG